MSFFGTVDKCLCTLVSTFSKLSVGGPHKPSKNGSKPKSCDFGDVVQAVSDWFKFSLMSFFGDSRWMSLHSSFTQIIFWFLGSLLYHFLSVLLSCIYQNCNNWPKTKVGTSATSTLLLSQVGLKNGLKFLRFSPFLKVKMSEKSSIWFIMILTNQTTPDSSTLRSPHHFQARNRSKSA